MTMPRRAMIHPSEVGTLHTWSRFVQQMPLLDFDNELQEHVCYRRQWLEGLMEYLASVFSVQVNNYNILSTHYHDVVTQRPDIASEWSDEELVYRARMAWPELKDGVWVCEPTDRELAVSLERMRREEGYADSLRTRLGTISGYKASLNETIAKAINWDRGGKGHVWDRRFGSRRIETDEDMLTVMVYNDLQQTRAGMAATLETSSHSAIRSQLLAWSASEARAAFAEMHGRECGETEADLAQLEWLSSFYAECNVFLSPINQAQEPLLSDVLRLREGNSTVPPAEFLYPEAEPNPQPDARTNSVLPSEFMLPQGFKMNTVTAADAARRRSEERNRAIGVAAEERVALRRANAEERRQRCASRRPKGSRSIHNRLRRRLKHRVSQVGILNIDFEHYVEILRCIDGERKRAVLEGTSLARGGKSSAAEGVLPKALAELQTVFPSNVEHMHHAGSQNEVKRGGSGETNIAGRFSGKEQKQEHGQINPAGGATINPSEPTDDGDGERGARKGASPATWRARCMLSEFREFAKNFRALLQLLPTELLATLRAPPKADRPADSSKSSDDPTSEVDHDDTS